MFSVDIHPPGSRARTCFLGFSPIRQSSARYTLRVDGLTLVPLGVTNPEEINHSSDSRKMDSENPVTRLEYPGWVHGARIQSLHSTIYARKKFEKTEVNFTNARLATMKYKRTVASATHRTGAQSMMIGVIALVATFPLLAQDSEIQERLAVVKQVLAENAQKLHQYQWTETTQLTLNGEAKPPSQDSCQYGPDGTVQKTLIGPPPEQPSGGPLMKRIMERKQEEMKEYMGQVKIVLGMYLPPDPQKMEHAKQAGNFSVNPVPGAVNLIFNNYIQPNDRMTLTFDTTARKITSVNVNTYMGDTQDAVTLQVQMASLPDGTNYARQTILNATAKQLVVTTTNSNYQRLGGY